VKRSRRALLTAMATMTPGFFAEGPAQAHSRAPEPAVSLQDNTTTTIWAEQKLKQALLALSPAEKLRIAGDRVRLARGGGGGARSSGGTQPNTQNGAQTKTQPKLLGAGANAKRMKTVGSYCSGMLFV
jgi:hypothetical protein